MRGEENGIILMFGGSVLAMFIKKNLLPEERIEECITIRVLRMPFLSAPYYYSLIHLVEAGGRRLSLMVDVTAMVLYD